MSLPVDISIVTPSLRQFQWLQLCAASVADQENILHEHIVQDAGTGDLVEQWARGIPNLTLYVEQDSGMYDAINRGLRRARGEICAYLNCDEQLLPSALARVSSFFDAHPEIDVLFGDAILVDEQGNPISYRRTVLPTLLHLRHAHLNTPTCSTFFRRKLLDRGFLFDPNWKTIGDLIWMEMLLRARVPMATLHEPLAVFAFTGGNLGSTVAAKEEGARWRGENSLTAPLKKNVAVVLHRARKFLAGAYWPRRVEIQIYTPDSASVRQSKRAEHVGFSWPKK